uniref:Uncharacterized protein n=1 Tax=Meloidogyne incognita TaxID=6306 RepID=A0A914NB43_MELIC
MDTWKGVGRRVVLAHCFFLILTDVFLLSIICVDFNFTIFFGHLHTIFLFWAHKWVDGRR